MAAEFSFRTRQRSLERFRNEPFDLLVIGGGITGAAVARDAVTRGLRVALVERNDFANGTSSRSSKLIHGGLRYLENFELGLVFEALSERALLLKTAPHMVRPLPFFLPVYKGDPNPKWMLSMGLWLYDLLALFRTPETHTAFSAKELSEKIPFLRKDGLKGGFKYYDASMWDDVLTIETLRDASARGAAIANYVEALEPVWSGDLISGFRVRDLASREAPFEIRASRTIVCGGPWTDELGRRMSNQWRPWLKPSKGVHLIFDLKRIPVPGALVMSHPEDGRISFVIPREDFGAGVVIVGTTDSPSPADPNQSSVEVADVEYLMRLLDRYFPQLRLKTSDILSAYVGVRPLMGEHGSQSQDARAKANDPKSASVSLQKISREHHIDWGPGGTVVVAGGKYTTHRKMAEQIVDFTLKGWKSDAKIGKGPALPSPIRRTGTRAPVNPQALPEQVEKSQSVAATNGKSIPPMLVERYGGDALEVMRLDEEVASHDRPADPEGFPALHGELRFAIRNEMVLRLEDFYLRRMPLYAARADHGLPWAESLARVWSNETGASDEAAAEEVQKLKTECVRRSAWRNRLPVPRG